MFTKITLSQARILRGMIGEALGQVRDEYGPGSLWRELAGLRDDLNRAIWSKS
jgi:hypothetical protein